MSGRERIDRALRGEDVDRPAFTFWYHFGLEKYPGERHAQATLDFHRKFGTDLVKVMSDFPYPKPKGNWWEVRKLDNPFPEQIRALEIIRDGLRGERYMVETIFNPWNVAEKLSSSEEVIRLKNEKPQTLLDALEVIAASEANHARRAIAAGAAGIFLAIANADARLISAEDYAKFSEPFDKLVLDAVKAEKLNILHLHGDKVYLARFHAGWPASVIHYSLHGTGVSFEETRRAYRGCLMGGIDERNFRTLTADQLRQQWQAAQAAAGKAFILAPGCSVPNETTDGELMRLVDVLQA
jgi:uroporphyrinogen decarboxylase